MNDRRPKSAGGKNGKEAGAVAAAGRAKAATAAPTKASLSRLHQELVSLFSYLNRLRDELAAIKYPSVEDLHFSRTGDQLQAIVTATEQATNAIMASVEKNEELISRLRDKPDAKALAAILDEMSENDMAIMEACSFQDLTGQRVTKVIKFVTHMESQIDALCDIWGAEGIQGTPPTVEDKRSDDEKLLRGPALKGEGVSQADIDALFD